VVQYKTHVSPVIVTLLVSRTFQIYNSWLIIEFVSLALTVPLAALLASLLLLLISVGVMASMTSGLKLLAEALQKIDKICGEEAPRATTSSRYKSDGRSSFSVCFRASSRWSALWSPPSFSLTSGALSSMCGVSISSTSKKKKG
jgi:hypothetical protein